jgi:quinol monooxygenase YgiN
LYDMSEPGSSIVELRRYALRPGARETLIELFEREFVETQEAVGARVLGTFRDADDPDSFVWIRGFTDMPARARALQAFYGGPVWAEHSEAANATMIDSDNVLLLRPVDTASRLALDTSRRAPVQTAAPARGVVSVTICPLEPGHAPAFGAIFDREIEPALRQAGGGVRARFVTEHSENTFPALPVREGEEVFVWLSLFADERARSEHAAAIDLAALLDNHLAGELETLRLQPTPRSLLPDETADGAPIEAPPTADQP